jgi:hypothetical protein
MSPEPEPIELVPLGRMTIDLNEPMVLPNTPLGTFVVAELAGARFEGERLKADAKGSANADWLTIGPDGTASIDVRVLLETDDGALIYLQYQGRLNLADQTVIAAPLFQTGDERYAWLNAVQAVAKGKTDGSELVYDFHEVR